MVKTVYFSKDMIFPCWRQQNVVAFHLTLWNNTATQNRPIYIAMSHVSWTLYTLNQIFVQWRVLLFIVQIYDYCKSYGCKKLNQNLWKNKINIVVKIAKDLLVCDEEKTNGQKRKTEEILVKIIQNQGGPPAGYVDKDQSIFFLLKRKQ